MRKIILMALILVSGRALFGQSTDEQLNRLMALNNKLLEYATSLANASESDTRTFQQKMIALMEEMIGITSQDPSLSESTANMIESLKQLKAELNEEMVTSTPPATFLKADEIIYNQRSRVHDGYGKGQYGASRDKGTRTHNGIDIIASPREKVLSPFEGVIVRETVPYKNDPSYRGILIEGTGSWKGYSVKIFYAEGLLSGQVRGGQEVAVVQDLQLKYPGITNHIHVEVRKNGILTDPFEIWQMSF
jgi:murein DD-endopeptidase MepM/ murein hydrolase activator NlpD